MKANLPQIRFQEPPQWQRERLRKWLLEWKLHLGMEEDETGIAGDSAEKLLPHADSDLSDPKRPFDAEIRPGDIRLIPFAKPDSLDLPLFCSVLSLWPEEDETTENRLWVTCLFSRMGEPGLPSEWQTGEDLPFSALSLWNSQLVPEGFLRNTWCLETWPDSTRQKALSIYKAWFLGQDIPADLSEEVGPPIRRSDDPRNQYLLQEQERGRVFGEAIREWETAQRTASDPENRIPDNLIAFPSPGGSESALLAARDDPAERPLVTGAYRVTTNPEITVQVSESVDPMKLALEVLEDSPGLLEGAGIFDATKRRLGEITDGTANIDRPKDGRFALFAADGTPILLEETPNDHRTPS